ELTGGNIHRHPHPRPRAAPYLSLAAGLLDGPFADRQDQPRVFGNADELRGTEDVLPAAVPADQRLHPGHRLRSQVDLWLIVQYELVPLQCLVQSRLERETLRRLPRQKRRAELIAVATGLFCEVESTVGVLQQRLSVSAILRVE